MRFEHGLHAALADDLAGAIAREAPGFELLLADLTDGAERVRSQRALQVVTARLDVGQHAGQRVAVRFDAGEVVPGQVRSQTHRLEAAGSVRLAGPLAQGRGILLDELTEGGIRHAPVTLHVGIGTFKPVTAKLVHEHVMDSERWTVPTARELRDAVLEAMDAGVPTLAIDCGGVRELLGVALGGGAMGENAAR